mgnify:CR=1 FL=1|tara:strand:- start:300 stop:515 length:216 start_codon:yes stop_codon:yes gene_type:complete
MFLDNGLTPEQQEKMDDIYESILFEVKNINPKLYTQIRKSELSEKDVLKLIHSKNKNIVENEEGQFDLFGE